MVKRLSAIVLACALVLCQMPESYAQANDAITTPCNAHLGSLASDDRFAYEKFFEHLSVPAAAAQYANTALPNTVSIIAVAPVTDDEYKTVFYSRSSKEALTAAQTAEVANVQATLKQKLGRAYGDRDFVGTRYKTVLQANKSSFIIVIGHNENGFLRLLDGSVVYLDEIVANARPDQRVILISCESKKRAANATVAGTVDRKLTYTEAFDTADRVSNYIKSAGKALSLVEVQMFLAKTEQRAGTRKISFFVMKAACALTTAILVAIVIRELDPCHDNDKSGTDKSPTDCS